MKNIIFITLLFFLLSACEGKHEPVVFIQGIVSGDTISNVTKKLNSEVKHVIEDTSVEADGNRPKYTLYRVRFNVKISGSKGKLDAEFYNGQLKTIFFYPDNEVINYDLFFKGYTLDKKRIERGNLKFWTNKDQNGKLFLAWEDRYLASQMSDWISKWS